MIKRTVDIVAELRMSTRTAYFYIKLIAIM